MKTSIEAATIAISARSIASTPKLSPTNEKGLDVGEAEGEGVVVDFPSALAGRGTARILLFGPSLPRSNRFQS